MRRRPAARISRCEAAHISLSRCYHFFIYLRFLVNFKIKKKGKAVNELFSDQGEFQVPVIDLLMIAHIITIWNRREEEEEASGIMKSRGHFFNGVVCGF